VNQREAVLAQIRLVPPLPTVVLTIRRLLGESDVSFSELSRAIEGDPDLAAHVLRLANSAYFGFERAIGSVREAIVRLGTQRIYHLVIALSVAPLAQRPLAGYGLPAAALWEHSVATATGADGLAEVLQVPCPDHLLTAGLLHDVGKVVLAPFIEAEGTAVVQTALQQAASFDDAERQVLGADHAEVGALLLERWNLPPEIVAAVRWHHKPSQATEERTVTDLVHVADTLSLEAGIGAGIDAPYYHTCAQSVANLQLTPEVSANIGATMSAGVAELAGLFGMDAQ
jgi:putative nucleotidyltransferase with HDIG domain